MDFSKYWLPILVVVAALPGLTVLLRGLVWGSDSFGFWAVSCGRSEFARYLSSPNWFVWFLENIVACDLYRLVFIMFLLYFFALLGVYQIGKQLFGEKGWMLPILVGCLTPLFFIEALRLENDFFGWTLMFVAVGLILIAFKGKFVLNKHL
jgi:hypothetical protein